MGKNREKEIMMAFISYFDGVGHYIEPEAKVSTYELGLTNLRMIDDNTLEVELRRPGLLIGKGGKDFNKLEKFLEVKINIKKKYLSYKNVKLLVSNIINPYICIINV